VVHLRRAQMILLSAQGMPVSQIAEVTFTSPDRVRDVIHNFNTDGFDSIYPRYRGGRPPTFTLKQHQLITAEMPRFGVMPCWTATCQPGGSPGAAGVAGARRCAIAAASTRLRASTLARMWETWTLAVLTLMTSCSAIWRLV
jgi:hypothetical protein